MKFGLLLIIYLLNINFSLANELQSIAENSKVKIENIKPKSDIIKDIQIFSPTHKLENYPIIIFIPPVGSKALEYNVISSELSSRGYLIAKISLSCAEFENIDFVSFEENLSSINLPLEKICSEIVISFKKLLADKKINNSPIAGVIGFKNEALIAWNILHNEKMNLKNPLFVSILDPTKAPLLAESISSHILFFNDFNDISAKSYNKWIEAINNQENLAQIGKKPVFHKWASQININPLLDLSDKLYYDLLQNKEKIIISPNNNFNTEILSSKTISYENVKEWYRSVANIIIDNVNNK